tara:strand:- start:2840 stop:3763 length:924 start_codon:yes stop_codon:yes gene_type:complete
MLDAGMTTTTITSLPACSNFTVSVEALNSLGSSGNATVGGDAVMPSVVGTIFTTPGIPADGLEPILAPDLPALDNETTLNLLWWAPFDNGVPLEQHELIVAPPDADASGDVICTTSAVDGVILDPACSGGPLYSTHCGAGGHSLCRECGSKIDQEPCSDGSPHALGDADAMGGGAVRIRVAHSGMAARLQQFMLFNMVKGTEYNVIVRARNELGWGRPVRRRHCVRQAIRRRHLRLTQNKAERSRGDVVPTRTQNDDERAEQRAEARASGIDKDRPGREVTNKRLTPRSTPRTKNKVDPTDSTIAKV